MVSLVGWFVARVVNQVLTNLLKAIGADNVGQRVGLSEEYALSTLVGRIDYICIILVSIIAALDQLYIATISEPTTQMLTTIVDAIPGALGAALVLVVSYVIVRLVSNLVEELLAGIGLTACPKNWG